MRHSKNMQRNKSRRPKRGCRDSGPNFSTSRKSGSTRTISPWGEFPSGREPHGSDRDPVRGQAAAVNDHRGPNGRSTRLSSGIPRVTQPLGTDSRRGMKSTRYSWFTTPMAKRCSTAAWPSTWIRQQSVYGLKPIQQGQPSDPAYSHRRDGGLPYRHHATSVQPRGPYLLGGLCAGGLIAFEMARQLQRVGEKVAMVALMDVARCRRQRQTAAQWPSSDSPGCPRRSNEGQGRSVPRRALSFIGSVLRKARNLTAYLTRAGSR